MNIKLAPVVDRELRMGARRSSTYWVRSGLGAGACVIWFAVLGFSGSTTPVTTTAKTLFWTVALLGFGYSLLSGIFLTADCISGEKRDGTLGLLFLTDLESGEIVLGKLAATSLHAGYGLLCVLPSLACSLLLGGVTLGEFWRVSFVLMVTMFLSLTVGLATSVVSRESRQAMIGTLGILVGLAAGPAFVWWLGVNFLPASAKFTQALLLFCPTFDLALAGDQMYQSRSGAVEFWVGLIVQTGMGLSALLLAARWVPRVWNDEREVSARAIGAKERKLRLGSATAQRLRRSLLDSDPFCWLSVRDRLPNLIAWLVVTVLFVLWAVFLAGSLDSTAGKSGVCFATAVFIAYGAYVLWKSFVAIEAARRISEDRHAGALELILVTTLDAESMLNGQRRALKRMFLGPGLVVLFMNVVMLGMVAEIGRPRLEAGLSSKTVFVFAIGAVCVSASLASLSNAGTWIGLRARKLQHAFVGMLGRVMLLPWLGAGFLAVCLIAGSLASPDEAYLVLLVWMLISLAVDGAIGLRSRKKLEKLFRPAAAGDFDTLATAQTEEVELQEAPQPA